MDGGEGVGLDKGEEGGKIKIKIKINVRVVQQYSLYDGMKYVCCCIFTQGRI